MRLRVYLDGRPAWSDAGPARARVAGYGGSALGHAITLVAPSQAVRRAAEVRRAETKRVYRERAKS